MLQSTAKYKHNADKKRAARAFLAPLFYKYKKLIGLAGPNVKDYYDWCKQYGFNEVTSYEYDKRVAQIQRCKRQYSKIDIKIKAGSIIKAPIQEDVFYDLDLCDTIAKDCNKELVNKFKDSAFLLTVCCRGIGYERTVKEFLNALGCDDYTSSMTTRVDKIGLGNNKLIEYTSSAGAFITLTYKDAGSPCMVCIAKI